MEEGEETKTSNISRYFPPLVGSKFPQGGMNAEELLELLRNSALEEEEVYVRSRKAGEKVSSTVKIPFGVQNVLCKRSFAITIAHHVLRTLH